MFNSGIVRKTIIAIFVIAIIMCVGFMLYLNQTHKLKPEKFKTSSTIAVVNQDEGVQSENGMQYLGTAFINRTVNQGGFGDTVETVSYQEATAGIESGKYAGYIVIPADFTANTHKLTANPSQATISYKISNKVDQKSREQALIDIAGLIKSVNSGLGALYVEAIMEPFHRVQDNAGVIIKNDVQDGKLLNSISPYSLITGIKIPKITEVENNVKPIKVDEEFKENDKSVDSIQSEYEKWISASAADLRKARESAVKAKKSVDEIGANLDKYDAMSDMNGGNNIYSQGIIEVNKDLSQLIKNANEKTKRYYDEVEKYKTAVGRYKDNEKGYASKISEYKQAVNDHKDSAVNTEKVSRALGIANKVLIAGLTHKPPKDNKTIAAEIQGSITSANLGVSSEYILRRIKCRNWQDFVTKSKKGSSVSISSEPVGEVKDYTPYTVESISDIGEPSYMGGEEISQIDASVKANIIDKIKGNADNWIDKLKNIFGTAQKDVETSNEDIKGYNPQSGLDDTKVSVGETYRKMKLLNSGVQAKINKQTSDYVEFAGRVYKANEENIKKITEAIEKGDKKNKELVFKGLKDAKESRNINSSRNKKYLTSFMNTLKYTRNGTQGNKVLYSYIGNPTAVNDEVMSVEVAKQSEENNYGAEILIICAILIAILSAIAYFMLRRRADFNR